MSMPQHFIANENVGNTVLMNKCCNLIDCMNRNLVLTFLRHNFTTFHSFFPQIPPGENVRMDAAMVESNLASPWPPVEVELRSSESENDFSNSDCLNNLEIVIEERPISQVFKNCQIFHDSKISNIICNYEF